MKFNSIIATLCLSFAFSGVARADSLADQVQELARGWDHANFEIKDSKTSLAALKTLEAQAAAVAASNPKSADPLVWKAIIVSTEAGDTGGLGALGMAGDAKKLLEKAAALNPNALGDGSVYTTLGSLYYQVPGFPIGFGDSAKARNYLLKGLAQNPSGLDANYFYGDYLFHQGKFADAKKALETALNAPARPDREVGDKGRRAEVAELLAQVKLKLEKQ